MTLGEDHEGSEVPMTVLCSRVLRTRGGMGEGIQIYVYTSSIRSVPEPQKRRQPLCETTMSRIGVLFCFLRIHPDGLS